MGPVRALWGKERPYPYHGTGHQGKAGPGKGETRGVRRIWVEAPHVTMPAMPSRPRRDRRRVKQARALRREATPSEDLLWQCLRGKRLNGLKFYRQRPRDRWFVDFYCAKAKLVVELDGGYHRRNARDVQRDHGLQAMGLKVRHIKSRRVFEDLEGVLEEILGAAGVGSPVRLVDKQGKPLLSYLPGGCRPMCPICRSPLPLVITGIAVGRDLFLHYDTRKVEWREGRRYVGREDFLAWVLSFADKGLVLKEAL